MSTPQWAIAGAASWPGIAASGPILVAVGVAALAGLVSFLSPCVLPLVPGYLSYMTGLSGADLDDAIHQPTARSRGRIALGAFGFIAGFTAIYTVLSLLAATLGRVLLVNERWIELVAGILIIGLGLVFLGLVPGLERQWRLRAMPSAGLAGAPLLGGVFALSWIPCTSPTLGAVLGLSLVDGSSGRAVTLIIAYCLGLGLPFLIFGLGFRKLIGVFKAIRRHNQWVTRLGGAMLIAVGVALATGVWGEFLNWLRASVGPGAAGI
jgi:cytochrome c-type biogenesis protein